MRAKHVELVGGSQGWIAERKKIALTSALKVDLVLKLLEAGAKQIEIGAFSRPNGFPNGRHRPGYPAGFRKSSEVPVGPKRKQSSAFWFQIAKG